MICLFGGKDRKFLGYLCIYVRYEEQECYSMSNKWFGWEERKNKTNSLECNWKEAEEKRKTHLSSETNQTMTGVSVDHSHIRFFSEFSPSIVNISRNKCDNIVMTPGYLRKWCVTEVFKQQLEIINRNELIYVKVSEYDDWRWFSRWDSSL